MEIVHLENYTFCYPHEQKPALDNVNLIINQGDFVAVCATSGSGKTTLLKTLKPELAPHGKSYGKILFCGKQINESTPADSSRIGFVMQNPDSQIVTDTVWHELAFGLENMAMEQSRMRIRIGEIASFFGIEKWFHKATHELSGGQKQILNLASVMVMEPELLILDEPTSRLDPIAAGEFFSALKKINAELGTTIILSEHRTEEVFPLANRVVIMEEGSIIADTTPGEVARVLKRAKSDMFRSMPPVARIFETLDGAGSCPVSVSQARVWLDEYMKEKAFATAILLKNHEAVSLKTAVFAKDIYYKYDKKQDYVLSGLSLDVKKGEIYGILGGNGAGKSTLLWLLSGGMKMQSGKIKVFGKLAMLPQNPECLFIKDTVFAELLDVAGRDAAEEMLKLCKIEHLKERHPYDLSGGEQQKLALCKILLQNPDVILLDEPTKGLDAYFKDELRETFYGLRDKGATIIMVSHDIEFCAEACDRCGLMFDGEIVSSGTAREFFCGNKFYTTQTARLFKGYAENIILPDEAVEIFELSEGTE